MPAISQVVCILLEKIKEDIGTTSEAWDSNIQIVVEEPLFVPPVPVRPIQP